MALNEESIVEKFADSVIEGAISTDSKKRALTVVVAILFAVLAGLYLVRRIRTQSMDEPIEELTSVAA